MNPQSLFILCWNASADDLENDVVHWLKVLGARCPEAVVLPVATRIDGVDERDRERRVALFDTCLRGEAAGRLRVQPVLTTSAKTFEGVENFAERVVTIYRTRELFPRVGFLMPPSWVRCRNFITALRDGHDFVAATRREPCVHVANAKPVQISDVTGPSAGMK